MSNWEKKEDYETYANERGRYEVCIAKLSRFEKKKNVQIGFEYRAIKISQGKIFPNPCKPLKCAVLFIIVVKEIYLF